MNRFDIHTSWHSYARLYAIGHGAIKDVFSDDVVVEEKIDGSQISFGIFGGELKIRSKGATINLLAPEKMFVKGVEYIQSIQGLLVDGWTYRGEYLQAPKHNVLAYERNPTNYIIGFDINTGQEIYMSPEEKKVEFAKIGLECVPVVFQGKIEDVQQFRTMLEAISVLGKQKIEGVVVKNYKRFTLEGKAMMGKFVSETFKEIHNGEWRENNPGNNEIIAQLVRMYKTPARWQKAVQHLKEAGLLTNSPKDIGALMKEVCVDVHRECLEDISKRLVDWGWPQVSRGLTHGLAQWYKDELLKSAFEDSGEMIKQILDEDEARQKSFDDLTPEGQTQAVESGEVRL